MKRPIARPTGFLSSLLIGLALLGGCAHAPGNGGNERLAASSLERRTLAIKVADAPNFYADTPDRRFYGLLGVFSMASEGNRIVRDLNLSDPAQAMAEDVRRSLNQRFRLVSAADAADDRKPDLELQIRTVTWDFRPYRNDPERSYVVYAARVELADLATGRTIYSERCQSRPAGPQDLASVTTLLEDGGRRLREELREAAGQCFAALQTGPLGAVLRGNTAVAQR